MKRSVCCIFVLLSLSVGIKAGDTINVRYTPTFIDFFETSYSHTAAALWRPVRDKVTVATVWQYRDAADFHLIREGRNSRGFGLSADGIQRDSRTAFWGSASYHNTLKKGTNWTEVSDLQRMGPYQIADSVGGNVYGEAYLLSGGFTSTVGRYNWGIEAGYRAGNDYRKRDPRPQATVSEPWLRAGGGMKAGDYRVGVAISAASYQQHLKVSTVESHRSDAFFAMKGFGMYDRQQSGYSSYFSWDYAGMSYDLSLFLLPEEGNGWIASGKLQTEYTESYSGQNIYPFLYRTNRLNLQAGHSQRNAHSSQAFKLEGHLRQGSGTERIYEHVSVNENQENEPLQYENRLLSESDRYAAMTGNLKATFLQEWYRPGKSVWAEACGGVVSYSERYNLPDYRIGSLHLDFSVKSGIEAVKGMSAWIAEVKIGYRPMLSSERIVPETDPIFLASMAPDVAVALSSPVLGECMVQYEYLKEKIKWFLSGKLSVYGIKGRHATTVGLSAGIKL